jgi:hypothetical protein
LTRVNTVVEMARRARNEQLRSESSKLDFMGAGAPV